MDQAAVTPQAGQPREPRDGTPWFSKLAPQRGQSEPKMDRIAELPGTLSRLGRLHLFRQYEADIVQADVLLARDSWRLVEAVTGATSADDLSERLRALISE